MLSRVQITVPLLLLLLLLQRSLATWQCSFSKNEIPSFLQMAAVGYDKTKQGQHSIFPFLTASAAGDLLPPTERWPHNQVPYVIDPKFSVAARQRILADMSEYHRHTCVTFVPRAGQEAYLELQRAQQQPHRSTPPLETGYTGERVVTMEHQGVVEHVGVQRHLLTVLGLEREDTRPDRDQHLYVSWDGADFLEQLLFQKRRVSELQQRGFPYDARSATHLSLSEASFLGMKMRPLQRHTHLKYSHDGLLSDLDLLKVRTLYSCRREDTLAGIAAARPSAAAELKNPGNILDLAPIDIPTLELEQISPPDGAVNNNNTAASLMM